MDTLASLSGVPATLVFYETGPRLVKALDTIAKALPGREVAVARELTKLHEECRAGAPDTLAEHYSAHPPKGEIVLLVGPPPAETADDSDPDDLLRTALDTLKPSQAAAQVARMTGRDRKALYARALELGRR
jgi:16S rRNA (cytidine1402-2'-O)-methyltransferase